MRLPRFRLIPREEKFYADFIALADELVVGAGLLEALLATDPPAWDKAAEIQEAEHRCDSITHEIFQRLNRTFVTPLDREDIHGLARSLDDVMDAIDASAAVVRRYRIDKVRFGARELARIIARAAPMVRQGAAALEQRHGVHVITVEINRLENEADDLHDEALRRLFDEERDPLLVMKWKEVLDLLEEATDRCEDVANVFEAVVVKHG
jgi:predicted phosphate transport protein (TIGR00153 family)